MSEEVNATNCDHDCSSCGSTCSERTPSKEDFLVPMNKESKIKRVIGVVSGKGGVGKSFVTSALAAWMNRKGYKTAVLDADITGPSIPKSFGLKEKASANERGILPSLTKSGIEVMSVNLLLDHEETPVIWRGPVIAGTVKQFWSEVLWGDVDYMFVDMPPGTGDVPLTVFQSLPLDGILIVTSPQELVSMIVAKAVHMAEAMDIPVLGFIENYSYITCGSCGEKLSVFGESHIDEIASRYALPVLAKLPIDSRVAKAADAGMVEELEIDWFDAAGDYLTRVLPVEGAEAPKLVEVAEEGVLKIAVTTDENQNVYAHFGHCECFTIYEIDPKGLVNKAPVAAPGGGHSSAIAFLKEHKVNVLICGGIGKEAMDGLIAEGIRVIPGISGDIDVAVAAFLDGTAAESNAANCHSHDDCGCGGGCGGCCGCH
ncbi:MAG: P-loop NTPase [Lachnospiraceae bacterium]|nr:P-loop NTPase [Lachnospiraceae bacterium]